MFVDTSISLKINCEAKQINMSTVDFVKESSMFSWVLFCSICKKNKKHKQWKWLIWCLGIVLFYYNNNFCRIFSRFFDLYIYILSSRTRYSYDALISMWNKTSFVDSKVLFKISLCYRDKYKRIVNAMVL